MKRNLTLFIFCAVALIVVLIIAQPATANADIGPKPSINITFKNLGDNLLYGTLLSKHISTGPYSAYAPDEGYDYKVKYDSEEDEHIWQVFAGYEDADGYYFMQTWWKLGGESNIIHWGYFPPYSFKLLLYYPASDAFVISDVYERYAFDSYYTLDMKDIDGAQLTPDFPGGTQPNPGSNGSGIIPELIVSYDYLGEIVGLLCRIALTILIELLIALLFRIKGRKPLLTVLVTNCATQVALNVALNLIYYFNGALAYLVLFILSEIAVVIIEAVVYSILLRKYGVPVWKSIVYALTANVVTAVGGFFIAKFLPGMF